MADMVSSLFGLQPWQVQQQQAQSNDQMAMETAKLDPFQFAKYAIGSGAGMLARPAAEAMGMVNPAMQQAQQTAQGLQGLDITDPKSILERAQQVQDPQLRMRLQMLAVEKAKEQQALAAQQTHMKLEEARAAQADAMANKLANPTPEPEGKYATPQAKLIQEYRSGAIDKATFDAAMRKLNYLKPEGGDSAGLSAGEMRRMQYEDKMRAAQEEKVSATKSLLDTLSAVERNIGQLYDPNAKKLKPEAAPLFGQINQYRGDLMLSQKSVDAMTALNGLKDQITMTNLAEAKKSIGQSFGSMQVQEWDKFVRLLASLDRKMSPDTAKANLAYIQDFVTNKRNVLETALASAAAPQRASATQGMQAPKRIKFDANGNMVQ